VNSAPPPPARSPVLIALGLTLLVLLALAVAAWLAGSDSGESMFHYDMR